jgi:hypothetical protein
MARRNGSKHASLFSAIPQEVRLSILGSKSAIQDKGKGREESRGSDEDTARPPKKRKLNSLLPKELERYDATGLVPHYTSKKQVPEHLQKCEDELKLWIKDRLTSGSKTSFRGTGYSHGTPRAASWMKKVGSA